MFLGRYPGWRWRQRSAFLLPRVSHRRQSNPRPEYAMQALRRCGRPLTIAVHINRDPESVEWPTLFVAARLDAHIEKDLERLLIRQSAVLVEMVDHIGVRALDILRIDLEVLD